MQWKSRSRMMPRGHTGAGRTAGTISTPIQINPPAHASTPIQILLDSLITMVFQYAILWAYLLAYINLVNNALFHSWTGVGLVVSMAATWLFAVALARIPITRRMCREDLSGLSILCLVFCVLWTRILVWYDHGTAEPEMVTWADVLKRLAIFFGSTLAWALEFVVMLCFWGNLQWKDPIATSWRFITLGPVDESDPENDLDLCVYSSLLHEDPDLLPSQLDEKVFTSEV
ncbi:uncharacterized protein F5147DRAFT_757123 [Suillus discolor]|uniref:Uncharacterized protein n=1 Tax=Suillus discolor TaxID=1912936 RepID=A0A9P7FM09_9AGAM|nr:uncharacterized protein F5147DRAFT_757123 [Suillus discolor]KAG2119908.1 hypothetical protein F5147DRAFT_757123 [Suillus discolor]